MPYNFKGKHYDLRPYVDETNCVVIMRGAHKGRFHFHHKTGKLISDISGPCHIDKYDEEMMKKQARKLIPKLLGSKNEQVLRS